MPSMGHPLLPLISWLFVSHALQRSQCKENYRKEYNVHDPTTATRVVFNLIYAVTY